MKTMKITTRAYNHMLATVGSRPAESGGLLFGSRTDWVVTKFLYDKNAKTTSTSYSFDVGYLNPMMDQLADEGLQLLGFFHSHPPSAKRLSEPDKHYVQSQFKNIPVDKFYVPLMFPAVDDTYDFIPYVFHKDGKVEQVELEVLPDNYQKYIAPTAIITPAQNQVIVTSDTVSEAQTTARVGFSFETYSRILLSVFYTGLLIFSLWVLYFLYQCMSHLLNPIV